MGIFYNLDIFDWIGSVFGFLLFCYLREILKGWYVILNWFFNLIILNKFLFRIIIDVKNYLNFYFCLLINKDYLKKYL